MKEADNLASQIRLHNRKYWVENAPEIPDEEYDALVEALRKIAPNHEVLSEISEGGSGKKFKHLIPMLSLDKLFSIEEIGTWADGCRAWEGPLAGILASYKVDGLSCAIHYEDGRMIRAATRGDGKEGDDVTQNVAVIPSVPHSIKLRHKLEIRGEVYMTKASFERNISRFEEMLAAGSAKEEERPKNARNFCAGSLKQKDPETTNERGLSFMAHALVMHKGEQPRSEAEAMDILEEAGFITPRIATIPNKTEIAGLVERVGSARPRLPYDTDGIVFGVNNVSLHAELGATGHHPKYKIAFKFAREQGETVVEGINWETSRNGRVMPVLRVKPIALGGAVVAFCTAHHAKHVKELGLAAGDKVLLEREVIPYLVRKTSGATRGAIPDACPSCGTGLEWDETETHLLCPNQGGCSAQLLDYICHYVSKKVCNISGVGEALIKKLLDAKMIATPADLYRLQEADIVAKLDRQGESSAKKIVGAIMAKREQPLAMFLQSLGIPHLGETVSGLIAKEFKTLDAVLSAGEAGLKKVEKMGDKKPKIISAGLQTHSALIADLLKEVKIIEEKKVAGILTGKSFCLTGKVVFEYGGIQYDSRPAIEALIKSKGGDIKSVSKNLSFLVVGTEAGDKVEKAKKAGVQTISGSQLLEML